MRRLSTMCSAIFRRITDIGTTSTLSPGLNAGTCAAGCCGAGACAAAFGAAVRGPSFRYAEYVVLRDAAAEPGARHERQVHAVFLRDSPHERRRLLPLPLRLALRRGRSWRGNGNWRRRRSAAQRPPGLAPRCDGRDRRSGRERGRAPAHRPSPQGPRRPPPASPITATTEFTGTVSPSFARISTSTPAEGDGISASTLSVEISKSGSSRSTRSPTS